MNTAAKTILKKEQTVIVPDAKVVAIKPDPTPTGTEGKIIQIIGVGQKIKRRSEVVQAKANLQNFIFSADHNGAEIEFQDANRKTYTSKDPYLMKKIQKCILDCCDEEIAQLNAEIDSFKI